MLSRYLFKKNFSFFQGSIKKINLKTNICFKTSNMATTVVDGDETKVIENEVRSKDPMESVIFSLNLCKVKTFEFHTKKRNIDKFIGCITFHTLAEFDGKTFTGVSKAPNRYTKIEMNIEVRIKEEEKSKVDLKDIEKQCIEISHQCPVYFMLHSAGCPIDLKYKIL